MSLYIYNYFYAQITLRLMTLIKALKLYFSYYRKVLKLIAMQLKLFMKTRNN